MESYTSPASDAELSEAARAMEDRGFAVSIVADGPAAKAEVMAAIPFGAEVHQGSSATLEEIGVTAAVEESGRYDAVRPRVRGMDRERDARRIRQMRSAPDIMLGSVQAVTLSGSLLVASNTGSQLAAYASGAGRAMWIVGSQKVVRNVEDGLRRIHEYCYPIEEARAQRVYGRGSGVSKILIIHRETVPGRARVILVRSVVGV